MMSSSLPAGTFMVSTIVCVRLMGFLMTLSPPLFPSLFPSLFPNIDPQSPTGGPQSAFLGNAWETSNCFPLSFTITSTEGVGQEMAKSKAYYYLLFRGFCGGVWGLDRGYCMM